MKPRVTLRQALEDPELLGSALSGPTWHAWRVVLLAAMGEPLTKDEMQTSPLINSGAVDLLEHDRLVMQLTSLERRTARGGRDSIDHAPGAHDDIANAAVGALVIAYKEPGVSNFRNVIIFPKVGGA
jgi:hypothetical protein